MVTKDLYEFTYSSNMFFAPDSKQGRRFRNLILHMNIHRMPAVETLHDVLKYLSNGDTDRRVIDALETTDHEVIDALIEDWHTGQSSLSDEDKCYLKFEFRECLFEVIKKEGKALVLA
jgi:hypothetical protein